MRIPTLAVLPDDKAVIELVGGDEVRRIRVRLNINLADGVVQSCNKTAQKQRIGPSVWLVIDKFNNPKP